MKKNTTAKVFRVNQTMGGRKGPCQPPKKRVTVSALATMIWQYYPNINRAHFMEL